MTVNIQLCQGAYVYLELLVPGQLFREPLVKTVYSLYDYRLVRFESCKPPAELLFARNEIKGRKIDLASLQQIVLYCC